MLFFITMFYEKHSNYKNYQTDVTHTELITLTKIGDIINKSNYYSKDHVLLLIPEN